MEYVLNAKKALHIALYVITNQMMMKQKENLFARNAKVINMDFHILEHVNFAGW